MLRLRFLPGLILGLMFGLPAGIVVGILVLAPHGTEQSAGASSMVQDLSRKLEAAKEARDRADRQLEQFQKLADQMTASFNNLEMRFKLLEEEQHVREVQAQAAEAAVRARAPAAPTPAATATAPPQALQSQTPEATPRPDTAEAPGSESPTQPDPTDPEAKAPAEATLQ
jgi:TolA-binding protein